MKKNMGKVDRTVRLILAALLLISYFAFNLKDFTGIIVLLLAVLLAVTGFTGTCPIYYIFRTDTLEKEDKL